MQALVPCVLVEDKKYFPRLLFSSFSLFARTGS
jgi:hypothetical protein